MKLKLSFNEPTFYVNESKKTVTCVMGYRLRVKGNDALAAAIHLVSGAYLDNDENAIRYPFVVSSTAKLNPLDKFDVETGKKVARAKAESLAYKHISRTLNRSIGKFVRESAELCAEFNCKAFNVCAHNDEYISKF